MKRQKSPEKTKACREDDKSLQRRQKSSEKKTKVWQEGTLQVHVLFTAIAVHPDEEASQVAVRLKSNTVRSAVKVAKVCS